LEHFSAKAATWLFLRKLNDLDEKEQEELRLIREASPRAQVAYQVVSAFMHMLRERTGEDLENWLDTVEQGQLVELAPFVTGIQRDQAAVLAGLSLPWSNGPLEGQVNRLKLIKRSMYGRAQFDLLKLRVLHPCKKSQDRKNKRKSQQAQPMGRLKKTRGIKNSTNSQYTIIEISKVA
jgi:transposase